LVVWESEILRIVDGIHREKNIDKEIVFRGIEAALLVAAKKHYGEEVALSIEINRETGAVSATRQGEAIHPEELGRIAAQVAKQIITQKIREAERDVIFSEYDTRVGNLVNGTVQRFEGPNIVVNLGRVEGYLPKQEQILTEDFRVGDRVRALVVDVKKVGSRVRILLSRIHSDFVRKLFELEVPEIAENVVQIKGLAREAGHRTKIAVNSEDPRVDSVGACVGVRGSRIKTIVDELNGEKVDIVRWSDSPEQLIANALKPAEVTSVQLHEAKMRAFVIVGDDQVSLAIGKRGQNVRLASKLCGWEIDVTSPGELQRVKEATAPEAPQGENASRAETLPSEKVEEPQGESGSLEEAPKTEGLEQASGG